MTVMTVSKARARWSQTLRIAARRAVVLTRWGVPVALLQPARQRTCQRLGVAETRAALLRLIRDRRVVSVGRCALVPICVYKIA